MSAEDKMSWANKIMIGVVIGGVSVVAVAVWIFWNIASHF